MNNMNYFDVIILALICILGLKGLFRGFIKELFALIGIVGGVYVASRLSNTVGELLKDPLNLSNENTITLIGFISSLFGFWILAYFLGLSISKIFQLSGLGIFDRFLGLVFGAGKIFLLFSIIIFALSHFESIKNKLENDTKDSFMYPLLVQTGNYIIKLDTSKIQNEISNELNNTINSTKELVKEVGLNIIQEKINNKLTNNENGK